METEMTFLSELERLKQAATNEFLEDRALPKLAFYLADHAEAIEELVSAAENVSKILDHPTRSVSITDASKLREALAKLEKP